MILAAAVDWEALLDVVVASLVVVVGVTIVFSLAIYGATRFSEVRRDEHGGTAVGYAVLAIAGLGVTGAVVAAGLFEMFSK